MSVYTAQLLCLMFIGLFKLKKYHPISVFSPEAGFEEFEPRFKFKLRLKYGWFHLKLYSIFQVLAGAQLKPVFGGFQTRLKFNKFGLSFIISSVYRNHIFKLVILEFLISLYTSFLYVPGRNCIGSLFTFNLCFTVEFNIRSNIF